MSLTTFALMCAGIVIVWLLYQYYLMSVNAEAADATIAEQKKQIVLQAVQLTDLTKTGSIEEGNTQARAEFYQFYLAAQARERDLFLFLQQHFGTELEIAQHENRPVITVACAIMLRQKTKIEGKEV